MRTLTIILIAAIFAVLGVLSAEAKDKQKCTDKISNEYCNPVAIVMPKTETAMSFEIAGKLGMARQLIFRIKNWHSGNATEIRSPLPFRCNTPSYNDEVKQEFYFPENERAAEKSNINEQPAYGDVPTPGGWYYCQIYMHGRDSLNSWNFQIWPSSNKQLFVVEGYWLEED